MRIEFNEVVTGTDLAQVLTENEGAFLCQQGGKSYIAVCERGHSIKSLRPVGKSYIDPASLTGGNEPWTVQRLDLIEDPNRAQSRQTEQRRP